MPEKIILDEELNIIKIESFGESTTNQWKESLKKVMDIANEHNIKGVLVNTLNQTTISGMNELDDFIDFMPNNLKFSIIMPSQNDSNHPTEAMMRFFVAIASIKDLKIQSFTSEEKAIKWLVQ